MRESFHYDYQQGQWFPLLAVKLHGPGRSLKIQALIDSGATLSVFRGDVGRVLGYDIEHGQHVTLEGIGAKIKGYQHVLSTSCAGSEFELPIVFSDELQASFNLLGRVGFFETFQVSFNESARTLELIN